MTTESLKPAITAAETEIDPADMQRARQLISDIVDNPGMHGLIPVTLTTPEIFGDGSKRIKESVHSGRENSGIEAYRATDSGDQTRLHPEYEVVTLSIVADLDDIARAAILMIFDGRPPLRVVDYVDYQDPTQTSRSVVTQRALESALTTIELAQEELTATQA